MPDDDGDGHPYLAIKHPFDEDLIVTEDKRDKQKERTRGLVCTVRGDNYARHLLGRMDVVCSDCGARMWMQEHSTKTRIRDNKIKFSLCCNNGLYHPEHHHPPPPFMQDLLLGPQDPANGTRNFTNDTTKNFRNLIRTYNGRFTFTALSVVPDDGLARSGPVSTFKIQGDFYQKLPRRLNPRPGKMPKYAEIYFMDTADQLRVRESDRAPAGRWSRPMSTDNNIIRQIQDFLWSGANPIVDKYKTAYELYQQQQRREGPNAPSQEFELRVLDDSADRRLDRPSGVPEIAVIIDARREANQPHSVKVSLRRETETEYGNIEEFSALNPHYMPMAYPLMFLYGDLGWHPEPGVENKETMLKYAKYFMMTRPDNFIIYFGKLFQQWVVDNWAQVEKGRLKYHELHQDELRAELYSNITEHASSLAANEAPPTNPAHINRRRARASRSAAEEESSSNVGRRLILNASFVGSDRYFKSKFYDGLALLRAFGSPSLFITFTCNIKWPEILHELLPGQPAFERPELIARIFHLKVKELNAFIKVKKKKK